MKNNERQKLCFREDLIYEYRMSNAEQRQNLYNNYMNMRGIFNTIELNELYGSSKEMNYSV